MVGVPKSTGCETCLKRKKKERPVCKACVNAGWKCPGYSKRWKFVDENTQLRTQYKKKRYIFEDGNAALVSNLKSHPNGFDLYEEYYGIPRNLQVGIFRSLNWEHEQDATILTFLLQDKNTQAAFPIAGQGAFYSAIPSRMGRNLALDAAVSCVCRIYLDIVRNGSQFSGSTFRQYAKSLNALRSCVEDPYIQSESETICASILLQLCELMLNADNGRWNHLSKGTKLLIENCGPGRFKKFSFELAMLESQRSFLIIQDMNNGQQCFLRRPEWRQLFSEPLSATTTRPGIALRSKFCEILVDVPDLISEGERILRERDNNLDPSMKPDDTLEKILDQVVSIYQTLETWYNKELLPLVFVDNPLLDGSSEQLQIDPGCHTPAHEYKDMLFAIIDCTTNSVLISLDRFIASLASTSSKYHGVLDVLASPAVMANRFAIFRSALAFVRQFSAVASKPLEFGLRQIWDYGSRVAQLPEGLAP